MDKPCNIIAPNPATVKTLIVKLPIDADHELHFFCDSMEQLAQVERDLANLPSFAQYLLPEACYL